MYKFCIEEDLEKEFSKYYKKNKEFYNSIMKKIEEIVKCEDVNHYKNLKYHLKDFKRVHILKSFVLIFKVEKNTIKFIKLKHHDEIYN